MSSSGGDTKNTSTQSLLSALVLNVVVAAVMVSAFLAIRKRVPRVYEPRAYLGPHETRSSPLGKGPFGFLRSIFKEDDEQLIEKTGMDAYFFIRFIKLLIVMFIPYWIITWAVLMPVYAVKQNNGEPGVDMFSFGNIAPTRKARYAAPLVVTWVMALIALVLIRHEVTFWAKKRYEWITSPRHVAQTRARTVLVSRIPPSLLDEGKLKHAVSEVQGGVRRVWIPRDLGKLPETHQNRSKAFNKLEGALCKVIRLANKNETKKLAKGADGANAEIGPGNGDVLSYVPEKKIPHHKLGFLGLFGQKVETIPWAKNEINSTSRKIDEERVAASQAKLQSSAFIEFNTQAGAHELVASKLPHKKTRKWAEVFPEDVVWSSMNIPPTQRKIRRAAGIAMTYALVIFWAIPVAFAGIVSNVAGLCAKAPFLAWICKLPAPVPGILQGALPPIFIAILYALLPIVLRKIIQFEGTTLHSQVELKLSKRYFIFWVLHGFLLMTLASGLVQAIPKIVSGGPSTIVTQLAQQLPKASTYFLTFIITTGLSAAGGGLLQIGGVVVYWIKKKFLGSTPRGVWNIRTAFGSVQFGQLIPTTALIAVIGLSYAVVNPIVCGFVAVAFILLYILYKYLFNWVLLQDRDQDTGGLFFPKSINYIFVGLYIQQIFITALLFFAQDNQGKRAAIPEGALGAALIVITALFHGYIYWLTRKAAGPLHPANANQDVVASQPAASNGALHGKETAELHGAEKGVVGAGNNAGSIDDHKFQNPVRYEDVPTVWLPTDKLGIGEKEVADLKSSGIDATTAGAKMSPKGEIAVNHSPPGEEPALQVDETDPKV